MTSSRGEKPREPGYAIEQKCRTKPRNVKKDGDVRSILIYVVEHNTYPLSVPRLCLREGFRGVVPSSSATYPSRLYAGNSDLLSSSADSSVTFVAADSSVNCFSSASSSIRDLTRGIIVVPTSSALWLNSGGVACPFSSIAVACLLCLSSSSLCRRLLMRNQMRTPTKQRPRTPPTTPPAIAPTLE